MEYVFVYGTLKMSNTFRNVTGEHPMVHNMRTKLKDYALYQVHRAGFPGIIPKKGAEVLGFLVQLQNKNSLRKLDLYEGEGHLYRREKVTVLPGRLNRNGEWVADNAGVEAYTYVFLHENELEKEKELLVWR